MARGQDGRNKIYISRNSGSKIELGSRTVSELLR